MNLKFELNSTITRKESVYSLCFLRDGRLVAGEYLRISIFDKCTCIPVITIESCHSISSVCTLRNGNLASSWGYEIIIHEIGEKEYKVIKTLRGHTDWVNKVLELEDGRICSCSWDRTIRVWDKNLQPVQILTGFADKPYCMLEMNNYLISAGEDEVMRIWNKYTYQLIKLIDKIYCCWNDNLSKLKDNTIIFGGDYMLSVIDISTFQCIFLEDEQLGEIKSVLVIKEGQALLANDEGKVLCYDSLSNQIIFSQMVDDGEILCIIKDDEDNKLFSASYQTINIYKY